MKNSLLLISTLLMLAIGTIACNEGNNTSNPTSTTTKESPSDILSPLDETTWILSEMNGKGVNETCLFKLHFFDKDGNYFESHNCCKNCRANYSIGTEYFKVIADTFRSDSWDCSSHNIPQDLIQQENDYFDALLSISSFQLQEKLLDMKNINGDTILTFTLKEDAIIDPSLIGTQWELISLNGTQLIDGTQISLSFEDYKISGFAGLNTYGAELSVANKNILKIYSPVIATSTGTFGGDIDKQESKYLDMLRSAHTYSLIEGHLEIATTEGEILEFQKATQGM